MVNDDQPIVRMSAITKRFLDVTANQDVTFDLYPGEICALLGENGAGKSTLGVAARAHACTNIDCTVRVYFVAAIGYRI